MIECTTEQSSLTYRWTYDTMLSALPSPGTSAFGLLCKNLKEYGMAPSTTSFESPSIWFSDANMRIFLLEERASLRFTFGGFELSANHTSQDDEPSILGILEVVFQVLAEIDKDSALGRAQITWNAHLSLTGDTVESFLSNHLTIKSQKPHLLPDAFLYRVNLPTSPEALDARLAVSSSTLFTNAIFINFAITYSGSTDLRETAANFTHDTQFMLELLELADKTSGKGESLI